MPRSPPRASPDHLPCQVRHLDEIDWETIRWPGETGKMLFHPSPEQPTAPNAGILRLAPGAHHPDHYHGFAQVWFILKGEFTIDGRLCPPGTMLYHPTRISRASSTPRPEVGPRQSPDVHVCGAVNDADPYSLCSRELLPAEVSPS
jgi:hypothetical protein